jgi:hypothetical protein
VRAKPRVRNPQGVGPDFGTFAIRPCCFDSVVVKRDVDGYLNCKLEYDLSLMPFDVFAVIQSVM